MIYRYIYRNIEKHQLFNLKIILLYSVHFSAIIITMKLNYLNIKKEDCNLKKLLFQENHTQLSNLSFKILFLLYFYYLKKKIKKTNLYKFAVLFLSLIKIHSMRQRTVLRENSSCWFRRWFCGGLKLVHA